MPRDTVVKVVMWSREGGSPDEVRLEQTPYPFHTQLILALFGHKITLYRFNQGGEAHTIAGGLKLEQGTEPLAPSL